MPALLQDRTDGDKRDGPRVDDRCSAAMITDLTTGPNQSTINASQMRTHKGDGSCGPLGCDEPGTPSLNTIIVSQPDGPPYWPLARCPVHGRADTDLVVEEWSDHLSHLWDMKFGRLLSRDQVVDVFEPTCSPHRGRNV